MKIGIIGTGRIAGRFVREASYVEGLEITAAYNPRPGSAERFVHEADGTRDSGNAEPRGIRAYDELEPFLVETDAVYIASPHETHFGYAMECLGHGKHVLCEKPMALSRREAEEAFQRADEAGLVLAEGIKTAYCPGFRRLEQVVRSGIIGEVRYVDACFTKLADPESREMTDRRHGGSFLELGSYCLLPVVRFLGCGWKDIRFESIRAENGLDVFTKAELTYGKGGRTEAVGTAACGLGVKAEGRLMAAGTEGYVVAEAPWWKTKRFAVYDRDGNGAAAYGEKFEGDGLRYELEEVVAMVREGRMRTPLLAWEESVALARGMEAFIAGK